MHNDLLLILFLLFIVFMLIMLGQKLKISYPIFLVVAGLGISFIPGMPQISMDPELIFLVFLPPLLDEAACYRDACLRTGVCNVNGRGVCIYGTHTRIYIGHGLFTGWNYLATGCCCGHYGFEKCKCTQAIVGSPGR